MVNPHRGEAVLSLAGQEYKTKLNLDSIARIETASKESIVKTMQRLASADLLTNEIVNILHVAIRGGGNDVDRKEVERLVWQGGLVEAMTACANVLGGALSSGGDEGNAQAVENE